ncbi:hypothetical protein [Novosphingobium sp. Fuku2-ISO-50]|uniref:hypothetical protein n=1 Tax=Novosphingobium sp. Fuku2-ISO-50 TaxID=1739114 RepID=UPI0009E76148|nr:hypothetical protein [Novosphingobium sp. Fuku2-ISO-50]
MAALRRVLTGTLIGVLAGAAPAHADVIAQSPQGFVSRNVVVVGASPAVVWKRLVAPAAWWSSDHTFSGDAANLSLDPVAGGCFCERLPAEEVATAKGAKPAARGGVEHMRVVFVDRTKALRLVGALGPLQSEAVNATLTVTITPVEGGTRVIFEYVVGGYMRYPAEKIVPAVDAMLGKALISLVHPYESVGAQRPAGAPDGSGAAGAASSAGAGLGEHGVLLPRGRIWSLPPSETPAAAPAPSEPTIAPLPGSAVPPDDAVAGGRKAAKRARHKPVAATSAAQAPVAPSAVEAAPDAPPGPQEVTASAPDAAQPPLPTPKAAKRTGKSVPKPAAKPSAKAQESADEPSKDAVNSAFDAALGDEQRPVSAVP